MNAILLLLLLLASIILSTTATATKTRRKDCYNSGDLELALGSALPGDDIVLFPGNFQGRFYSGTTQATADNPITIRSAIPSRKAVMSGMMNTENSVVLYITGNYWTVKDLIIENGQKGIVFDGVKGGKVLNCKVHNTVEQAIHIRDGSSEFAIEKNVISNTGSEGIAIGTHPSQHALYNPMVSFISITQNMIGANVQAEGIAVREGTHNIMIEKNIFDADGFASNNNTSITATTADSFISLKGSHCVIRANRFYQSGAMALTKGINAIDNGLPLFSFDHVIIDNIFNFDNRTSPMVDANTNLEQGIYVTKNLRFPAGDDTSDYSGLLTHGAIPDWYAAMLGRAPPPPTPQPTSRPTRVPTPKPSPLPTFQPSTPKPSAATSGPSLRATSAPPTTTKPVPTLDPTPMPTPGPTSRPTLRPTPAPSTLSSTSKPTPIPTAEPTLKPTSISTAELTLKPATPTVRPTTEPTSKPTPMPTPFPTLKPATPTSRPIMQNSKPTPIPTPNPTTPPPISRPTILPTTQKPTMPELTFQQQQQMTLEAPSLRCHTAGMTTVTGDLMHPSFITERTALVVWPHFVKAQSYKVRYKREDGNDEWTIVTGIGGFFYYLIDLQPLQLYSMELQLYCTNGAHSEWSEAMTFQTLPEDGQLTDAVTTPSPAPVDTSQSHVIYSNWDINTDFWTDVSTNGTFHDNYNDGGSHRSTYHAKMEPGGKIRFVTDIADHLTGWNKVRFLMRNLDDDGDAVDFRIEINERDDDGGAFTVGTEWHAHVFDFATYGSDVTSISFANLKNRTVTVLLDDLRFSM